MNLLCFFFVIMACLSARDGGSWGWWVLWDYWQVIKVRSIFTVF